MKGSLRGQASLEFLAVLASLVVVFFIIGHSIYINYTKSVDLKNYMSGQRLTNHIADGINSINAVDDGQSTMMRVPGRVFGEREYTIRFYANESGVFIEGGGYQTGRESVFSSPITTHKIFCLLEECLLGCNRSSRETCANITSEKSIRLVKYNGGVYLSRRHNIKQGDLERYIIPFEGNAKFTTENLTAYVDELGVPWNVIYLYKNNQDQSISLVFSMNLTDNERFHIDNEDIMGEVLYVESDDITADDEDEYVLDRETGHDGQWAITEGEDYDVDGAVVRFREGFSICIMPSEVPQMSDWTVIGYDGESFILESSERVCITYP
jgi:hypothetical protein